MYEKKVNEKAKAARVAYNKENIRTLATTVRKDYAERFKAYATAHNTTVGALIKGYVMDVLGKEEGRKISSTAGLEVHHPCSALLTAKNMDRLKHETAFYNPKNLNPDQLLNHILDNYFKMAEEIRTKG